MSGSLRRFKQVFTLLPLIAGCGRLSTISHGGAERSYLLHIPSDHREEMPLVVALHGGGGSASSFARYTGFRDLADEMGFIVVFPQELNNRWYDSIRLSREPEMEWVDDTDPEDGATAVLSEWRKDGRVVVALCAIEGGGHTLPGGRQYLPSGTVGNTCRDLDGSRAIIEFFLGL